jgi:fucose permease
MNNSPFKMIMAMAIAGAAFLYWADGKIQEMADDCAKRGGVMLKDYTCIKADSVVLPAAKQARGESK